MTRMTDEELTIAGTRARFWVRRNDGTMETRETAINEEQMALDVLAMLSELKERRALDLTSEEREALRLLHGALVGSLTAYSIKQRNAALSILSRLVKQEGES